MDVEGSNYEVISSSNQAVPGCTKATKPSARVVGVLVSDQTRYF